MHSRIYISTVYIFVASVVALFTEHLYSAQLHLKLVNLGGALYLSLRTALPSSKQESPCNHQVRGGVAADCYLSSSDSVHVYCYIMRTRVGCGIYIASSTLMNHRLRRVHCILHHFGTTCEWLRFDNLIFTSSKNTPSTGAGFESRRTAWCSCIDCRCN